jgi:DNA-binding NtrC family response regulator
MIWDEDDDGAEGLLAALREAGHEAEACRHTMDALRRAADGRFDVIAFGLGPSGFGRDRAVEALSEVAPRASLIAIHPRPAEIMRSAAHARLAAVLPRPVNVRDFMYAVACALSETAAGPA